MAYTLEEEQEISALKAWWKENATFIIVCTVLAFGGVFGWNYWQSYQTEKMHNSSMEYVAVIDAYSQDPKGQSAQLDQFVQQNSKSAYAVLALFEKAKIAAENQDFAQAESALKEAQAQSANEELNNIASLRLAAVQLQQKQFDNALQTLDGVKGEAWNSRKSLLIGDIQLAKGDKQAAQNAYHQAKQGASQMEQQLIQVRLNNL